MKNLTKIALATSLMVASSASIATTADGSLGADSTGTADVTLTISEQFQISNMSTLAFPAWTSGDVSADADICIYHNGDGTYQVTVTDDSVAAGLNIEDSGDANPVAITVNFNDQTTTTGNAPVTDGVALASQTGANTASTNCGGGDSANIEVDILGTNLSAVPAGSYDTELTVFVEPG